MADFFLCIFKMLALTVFLLHLKSGIFCYPSLHSELDSFHNLPLHFEVNFFCHLSSCFRSTNFIYDIYVWKIRYKKDFCFLIVHLLFFCRTIAEFPAVTICNENKLRKSKIVGTVYENIMTLEAKYSAEVFGPSVTEADPNK